MKSQKIKLMDVLKASETFLPAKPGAKALFPPVRILLLEDDAQTSDFIAEVLSQEKNPSFLIAVVNRVDTALRHLSEGWIDIILLDLSLAHSRGLETFHLLQHYSPTLPFIILSSIGDEAFAFEAVQRGAQDYLLKDKIHSKMLSRVIRYAIERKRIEEKLKALNDTLERQVAERTKAVEEQADDLREMSAALENAAEGIARMDREGRYLSVNKAYAEILGYKPEAMQGMSWEQTVYAQDREKLKDLYERLQTSEKAELDLRGVRRNGSIFYKQMVMVKAYDREGRWNGYFCFIKDITERKYLEYNEALELKSQFISMVSHELRTPLHAINEGIGVVLDGSAGKITPEQRDFLDIAKRNVDRLSRLIHEVLDYQRLEMGVVEYHFEENSLNDLIREVARVVGPVANRKGLTLELELAEEIPNLRLDRDKIIQVLMNIANNAIKFTDTGQVIVKSQKETNTVRVSIHDTGVGIRKENLGKLFKSFVQFGTQKDRKMSGTGLGLAISKKIIEQHGGRIWAESEAGRGTVVSFLLPVRERRSERENGL